MSSSDARFLVYAASKAVEVVGCSAPALNRALECWAALLTRSTADNCKAFSPAIDDVRAKAPCPSLHEWALLAVALKSKHFDPEFADPGAILAAALEDAHRLENAANKYYFRPTGEYEQKEVDSAVADLGKKLRDLDYPHAWALIIAVDWFWEHSEETDIEKDAWWTLSYRRQWYQKRLQCSSEETGPGDALHESNRSVERSLIQQTLISTNYNRSRTASKLGISRVTLYKKMKKYGLMNGTHRQPEGQEPIAH
jgi:hypothetical protein